MKARLAQWSATLMGAVIAGRKGVEIFEEINRAAGRLPLSAKGCR
jgi:hypothetical protein